MIKIALDMMGGDNAPSSNIYGAIDFLNQATNKVKIYMVGDENQISKLIDSQTFESKNLEIVHATQVVDFKDKPSKIIKTKPDSSMNKAIKLLKDKTVDAVLSSGSTGCLLSSSFFNLGTLPGIKRPALFANIPSENGNFLLCDVGANSSSKPDHLKRLLEVILTEDNSNEINDVNDESIEKLNSTESPEISIKS